MRVRQFVAIAAIVPLVAGVTAADAATKKKKKPPVKVPTCNLVTDAADDATDGPGDAPGYNDSNLDILSADVASNATHLAVAIRLKTLDASPDTAPFGRAYDVAFMAAGQTHVVRAKVGRLGSVWADGKGAGIEDTAKKEIRMWVPLTAFSAKITPGSKITNIEANSWRWVGTTEAVIGRADTAIGSKTYPAAWPSCLPVGR